MFKLAKKYLEASSLAKDVLTAFQSIEKLHKETARGRSFFSNRKLSLPAIGYVIEKDLLRDGKGHIYQWDPRYINRDVEVECLKQERANETFGSGRENGNATPIIKLLGKHISI